MGQDKALASDPRDYVQLFLTDERDGNVYEIVRIDSLFWFNENLSFQTKNSETIPKKYSKSSGRLYSYQDAPKACPDGWRLPTIEEFDGLIRLITDSAFYGIVALPFDWDNIDNNKAKFKFNKTGLYHKKRFKANEGFNMWLENDVDSLDSYHVHLFDVERKDNLSNLTIFRHSHIKHKPIKNRKFVVRCVCSRKPIKRNH